MKGTLRFLKGYGRQTVLSPLFKLLEATLELIVPLIIAVLIDSGINRDVPDSWLILRMSLLLVLLGAVGLFFSVIAQYYAAVAACGYSAKMRAALFSHIGSLSYAEIDRLGTSTLITRITSDTKQAETGVNLVLRLLLRSPFVVFGAMIMAFTIDFKSALTFVAVIPALAIVVFGIMLISIPLYKKVQGRLDRVVLTTRENLSGARVVRAFCREEAEISDFEGETRKLAKEQTFVGRISALMNPLTYILINLATVFLIYTGAIEVNLGNLTQGQVVALYNYMAQILVELIKLANLIITVTKSVASAGRINAVFAIQSSQSFGECEFPESPSVEFRGVSLKYGLSKENALSSLSFTAECGEVIGIIGGTGSGKTTLVNLICRFYDATEGEVLISGRSIKEYSMAALRDNIVPVPQRAVLFSGTIRDNMLFGNEGASDEQINEALACAIADGVVADKGGLDSTVERGGRNFSGGQKQRLTIARALVKHPKILILDDSASALDYATDAALRASLKKSSFGRITFIVSQRASSVMHADKIILLEDSHPIAIGTHDELLGSSVEYREIYRTQFSGEGAV